MNVSHKFFKRALVFAQLLIIALVSTSIVKAQTTSSVDATFNAVIAKEVGFNNFTLQPDGKILTFGNFQIVNGLIKNQIARLNPDGSLDNSFDCTACDFNVGSVVVQPDGKIIIAGSVYSSANQTSAARVKRLNADGSLDASFNSPYNSAPTGMFQGSTSAIVWAIQPDGKILVTITISGGGNVQQSLYRLNTDGSLDNSFSTVNFQPGRNLFELASKIAVSNSGKILISTVQPSYGVTTGFKRYNSDGTVDVTFESPTITGVAGAFGNGYRIYDFKILSDESVVIVGYFNTVNALNRVNIAKLLPAGNVDLTFAPTNVYQQNEAALMVDIFLNGKILVRTGAASTAFPVLPTPRFIRYNTDGSIDNTFIAPANLTAVNKFVIDSSDNVLLYGSFTEGNRTVNKFARLNMNGALISSFVVNYGIGGTVTELAIQTDGKVIIAGDFAQINGITRKNIARLNADGSLDSTFNPGTGFDNTVEKIVVLPDGKILVGGSFTNYNGTAQVALVRLNADGSLDGAFSPNIVVNGIVYSIDLQTDGKILIGGSFGSINGQTRSSVARLNADGSLDASFNPIVGGNSPVIRRVLAQPDGKILIGGTFSGVNGFARTNLVRLNADGSLDTTLDAGSIQPVTQIERQADGKYIVVTGGVIRRLNANGTADATFNSSTANGVVSAVLIQPDGSVIVGGDFTLIGGFARLRLARLKSDGTIDTFFFPNGADNPVFAIERQTDGKLLIGGSFTTIENITRLGVARIIVAPVRARSKQYDYDGDGRADLAVFRPSNGVWYVLSSQNNSFSGVQFGSANDKIAPADYDGDGKTDLAVFRENIAAMSTGAFYILNSSDNSFRPVAFGSTGDVPVSGDWDGDGIGDVAVYRDGSLTGGSSLFIYRPSSAPGVDFRVISWGAAGDKPVVGDYDNDGKLDAAIFRPSITQWYILRSSNNQFFNVQFGNATDILAPADYTGDGATDVGVFRPSNGTWYYSASQTTPSTNFVGVQFGISEDLPVPADYDGDGKADVAVFRPSNGIWYLMRSTAGFTGIQFGANGDKPAENAYVR
jgi:uncharacterized delta-60 repeat protein